MYYSGTLPRPGDFCRVVDPVCQSDADCNSNENCMNGRCCSLASQTGMHYCIFSLNIEVAKLLTILFLASLRGSVSDQEVGSLTPTGSAIFFCGD